MSGLLLVLIGLFIGIGISFDQFSHDANRLRLEALRQECVADGNKAYQCEAILSLNPTAAYLKSRK